MKQPNNRAMRDAHKVYAEFKLKIFSISFLKNILTTHYLTPLSTLSHCSPNAFLHLDKVLLFDEQTLPFVLAKLEIIVI